MVGAKKITVGTLVRHPKRPGWGLGKVLVTSAGSATIFFKDDAKDHRTFRLDKVNLDIEAVKSDPILDKLPPFIDGAFATKTTKTTKVTIQDGIEAFKLQFPLGFEDPTYIEVNSGELGGERNYKLRAHERYLDAFGDESGERLLVDGQFDELRERVQTVATKGNMNLLSPYEAMALRDGLAESDVATADFFRALFDFVKNGPSQPLFNTLADAVNNIPVKEGRARAATWPVQTLLPFLADPRRFMFLKPEPTRACADRLRFDLLYDSALRWATYERLMEMGSYLLGELRPLGARDFIDVQSFMWVIQKY